jgi:hypothetical protein
MKWFEERKKKKEQKRQNDALNELFIVSSLSVVGYLAWFAQYDSTIIFEQLTKTVIVRVYTTTDGVKVRLAEVIESSLESALRSAYQTIKGQSK